MKQLILPSIYKERASNPVPDKFKKFIGRPAMSYSTYNSFLEESYRGEWFANKFLNIPSEGNIFTLFGSSVGTYLETGEPKPYLSDNCMNTLKKYEAGSDKYEYEREVVIDRGSYILYGFIDRVYELEEGVLDVIDFKTGSIEKKAKDYSSPDYNQTTMYCHALKQEGYEINSSSVVLFDRKGNTLEEGNKNVLRLTGEIEIIPTPYSEKRANDFLKKVDKVAKEIETYYKTYNKIFL